MAAQGRNKTKYPGVYFTEGKSTTGKPMRRYSVVFKRNGKVHEEAAKVLVDGGPETRPAETPQEASTWRSRRIADVTDTKGEVRPLLTVGQIWENWREGKRGTRGLPTTECRYNVHVGPLMGARIAEELCNFNILTFRRDLEKRGLSPATVKVCMTLLSQLLRWGGEQDLIKDPGVRFDFPRFDNQKTECMTPDQLTRYWQVLDEWPDQNVASYYKIMLLTGIRRRALAAVRWEDLDLNRGFLTLRAQTAKSGKAKSIPLPAVAIKLFEAMSDNGSVYVWPDSRGGFRDMGIYGRRVREAAGLPKEFRPCHGLRHTFASMLASSGKVDLFTLQQMLTHASPTMTQRYAHLADDTLRRAASVADDVMTPRPALKVVAGKE
ncbi:MAG: site-specific integrase [Desulfomicrobium sp.]|nr:site-specific integrase [Desulfomicrobium sp.]